MEMVAALLLGLVAGQPVANELAASIQQRLLTSKAVAMAKHNSGAPVEDKARERDVVLRAVRLGTNMGVDPELALKVFRAQIEANKAAQRAYLAKWRGHPPFKTAPDLSRDVRPLLDSLTPRILRGLKERRIPASDLKFTLLDPLLKGPWAIAIQPIVSRETIAAPFEEVRLMRLRSNHP